jgi:hypothetical protein
MKNYKDNKFVQRLISEWRTHKRIIIGCDFDDTISPWKLLTQHECDENIKILIKAQEVGAYITIFTACDPDRYNHIQDYCDEKGLRISGINMNPLELQLEYGNNNKPYANIYIDDRGALEEVLGMLEFAMYTIISDSHKVNDQFVEF